MAREQKKTDVKVSILTARKLRREVDAHSWGLAIVAYLLENGHLGKKNAVSVQVVAEALGLDIDTVIHHARNTVADSFAICLKGDRGQLELGTGAVMVLTFLSIDPEELRSEASSLDAIAAHALARSRSLARTANAMLGCAPAWYQGDDLGEGRDRLSTSEAVKAAVMNKRPDALNRPGFVRES